MDHVSETHAFSAAWWEQHYRDHGSGQATPSPHLAAEVVDLPAGLALDAGCGAGADARWLAEQGWTVTAVDVSPTVVRAAEERTAAESPELVGRITWIAADLTTWEAPERYDLVVSQYVHPDIPFADFVRRLAAAVAPGGTLLVAGHDHGDAHSSAHAPLDASVSPEAIASVLDGASWRVDAAERRTVTLAGPHPRQDVVVVARRRTTGAGRSRRF
jgi:2-polyprenyl-3-methyl-5-hydroxy-6-metoxy-1,4-benzoquinol methylase